MSRKRHRYRRRVLPVLAVLMLICSMTAAAVCWIIKVKVEPNLEEIGRMRAKVIVSRIINKSVNTQFYKEADMDQLLIRKTDENGQLEILQANTRAMNLLITEITKKLQQEYEDYRQDVYPVPVGSLLGDKVLSNTGPEVNLKVRPMSVSSIDFKTEFESQGINQTKYKVYIQLTSQVKVLVPFAEETFQVRTTFLVAEAVILGNVPNSYVQVPEEDILDVTQE